MTDNDRLLDEIVATIVKEVSPEKVILFGSQVSGNARPDSDIDLLIVESEPFGAERSRRRESSHSRDDGCRSGYCSFVESAGVHDCEMKSL